MKPIIGTKNGRLENEKFYQTIFFILSFISCDPVTYVCYNIDNSTDNNLVLIFHSSIAIENDTIPLSKSSIVEWRIVSVSGKFPENIDLNQYYDSIIIESNNLVVKRYISMMNGKNIYNYKYWEESKKSKRNCDTYFR